MTYRTSRRQLLRTAGAVGSLGVAGCFSDDKDRTGQPAGTETATDTETPTGTPEPTESSPEEADLSGDELVLPQPYDEWTRIGHLEVKGGGLPLYDLSGDGEAQYLQEGAGVYEEVIDNFQTEDSGDDRWELANVVYPGGQVRIPEDARSDIPYDHVQRNELEELVGRTLSIPEFEFAFAKVTSADRLAFYAFYEDGGQGQEVLVAPTGRFEGDEEYFECEFEGRMDDDDAEKLRVRDGDMDSDFRFDTDEDLWRVPRL